MRTFFCHWVRYHTVTTRVGLSSYLICGLCVCGRLPAATPSRDCLKLPSKTLNNFWIDTGRHSIPKNIRRYHSSPRHMVRKSHKKKPFLLSNQEAKQTETSHKNIEQSRKAIVRSFLCFDQIQATTTSTHPFDTNKQHIYRTFQMFSRNRFPSSTTRLRCVSPCILWYGPSILVGRGIGHQGIANFALQEVRNDVEEAKRHIQDPITTATTTSPSYEYDDSSSCDSNSSSTTDDGSDMVDEITSSQNLLQSIMIKNTFLCLPPPMIWPTYRRIGSGLYVQHVGYTPTTIKISLFLLTILNDDEY